MDAVKLTRPDLVRRGERLEYFTVGYNSLEGLVSIVAVLFAGSVSLVGFGLDSAIEVASGDSQREPLDLFTPRFIQVLWDGASLHWRHTSPTNPAPR